MPNKDEALATESLGFCIHNSNKATADGVFARRQLSDNGVCGANIVTSEKTGSIIFFGLYDSQNTFGIIDYVQKKSSLNNLDNFS